MRLYVDYRCLQDNNYARRGVGLHTAALLRQARRQLRGLTEIIALEDECLPDPDADLRALADRTQHCLTPRLGNQIDVILQPSPMTHEPSCLAPLLGRPQLVSCAVVYDFIPLEHPERYLVDPFVRRRYLNNLLWLKQYDLYCPISQVAARGLATWTQVGEDRICIAGASVRTALANFDPHKSPSTEALTRFASGRYFLMVGGNEPRKNPDLAVLAHARLGAPCPDAGLVIVGNYGADEQERLRVLHHRAGGQDCQLEFLTDLTDEALAVLYHQALATIVPSLWEGFSLPVVEALSCGCPVLASRIDAHQELLDQPEALFDPHDAAALATMMMKLWHDSSAREELLTRQTPIARRFHEEAVGRRFWGHVQAEWRRRSLPTCVPSARRKPLLAFLTPYPPDQSGVGIYTAASLKAVARHGVVDVFTDATPPRPDPWVRRFQPISEMPYVVNEYDRIVAVVGNSYFHQQIVEYVARYGGPCIAHDNRLAEFYDSTRGLLGLAELATRCLGRPVSMNEAALWLREPDKLPSIFFAELLPKSEPLIVHSRGILARIRQEYGREALYLPFCGYRTFGDDDLSEGARRRTKKKLGLPDDRLALITLGFVNHTKGPLECLDALRQLRDQGIPADLHFVGGAKGWQSRLPWECAERGLNGGVHVTPEWIDDAAYHDYLLAADFAIQLRTHGFGGLSGGLLECIFAGLPTVANEDLAGAMEAPDYVLRVPDRFTGADIAERIATAFHAGRHHQRQSEQRKDYVHAHSFERYAVQLMEVLDLAA